MRLHREEEFEETKLFKCSMANLEYSRKSSLLNSRRSLHKVRVEKNRKSTIDDTAQDRSLISTELEEYTGISKA